MSDRVVSIDLEGNGTLTITTEKKDGSRWVTRGCVLTGVSYEQDTSDTVRTKEETVVQGEHRLNEMGDQAIADGSDSHIRKDG